MLEGDDRRRMTRAGAERIGARKRVPVSVSATTTGKGPLARAGHLGERDAALTGLELLGRAGAFVPLFLSPISPHLMPDATVDLEPISSDRRKCGAHRLEIGPLLLTYLFSEGTYVSIYDVSPLDGPPPSSPPTPVLPCWLPEHIR